jgi:lipase chaperone LimK
MGASSTGRLARLQRLWPIGWVLVGGVLSAALWIASAGFDQRAEAGAPKEDGPGFWARAVRTPSAGASTASLLATGLEQLPRSLEGTDVDGGAEADAAGHLKPDFALRRLFDYFLSTVGEEPLPRVRDRLQAWLRSKLPPPAAREAMNLLDRYLAYQQARGELGQGAAGSGAAEAAPELLQQRFDALRVLRQQHFSPAEAAAFFGDEEAEDRYTLQRLAVLRDATLSPADKAQRLKQLAASLPPALQAAMTVEDKVRDLNAVTQAWREKGGTAQELREARVQLVGAEAADRLEALDQRRAQWGQRLEAYRARRAALQADASLSAQQREQALAQLRGESFTQQEFLRLDALMVGNQE